MTINEYNSIIINDVLISCLLIKSPKMFKLNNGDDYKYFLELETNNTIKAIGDNVFENYYSLKSINISNSVKKIGKEAFMFCKNLKKIDIPKSVTYIDDSAFECSSLTNISLSDSITYIGESAFANTNIQKIKLPKNIKVINKRTFEDCKSLKKITIPNGVTSISDFAFFGCENLRIINLPESVVDFTGLAFHYCPEIERIRIDKNNLKYVSIDNVIYTKDMKEIVFVPSYKNGTFIIPDGVERISDGAFDSCYSLTDVIMPDTIQYIGGYAFSYCWNVDHFNIPDKVEVLGDCAFYKCGLESVKLSKNLKEVECGCFAASCLEHIEFPNSLEKIDSQIFYENFELQEITIPENVKYIEDDAFAESNITKITVANNNKNFVVVDDVLFTKDMKRLLWCSNNKKRLYIIPEGVEEIDDSAFHNCNKIEEIIIPLSVKKIGHNSFYNSNLKQIRIPKSIDITKSQWTKDCKIIRY